MKKFNLLIEGTGIRFTVRPAARFFRESHTRAVLVAFMVSVLVIGYMAATNMPALTQWNLFNVEKEEALPADLPSPSPKKVRHTKKKMILGEKGEVLSVLEGKAKSYRTAKTEAAAPKEYRVRFALCLGMDCAKQTKDHLAKNGVASFIIEGKEVITAYSLKLGPVHDAAAQERTVGALEKLGVAYSGGFDHNYIETDLIWTRAEAGRVTAKIKELGVQVALTEKRKPKNVFKVVSVAFNDRSVALGRLAALRRKNIAGVIE